MRIAIATTALLAALLPGVAAATCKGLQCNDSLLYALVDEPSGDVWIQVASEDVGNLDCSLPPAPPSLDKSIPLRRTNVTFVEAYQIILLATASQLPVQINVADTLQGCRITGVILDPFGKLSP